jgi:hypothetical protein
MFLFIRPDSLSSDFGRQTFLVANLTYMISNKLINFGFDVPSTPYFFISVNECVYFGHVMF